MHIVRGTSISQQPIPLWFFATHVNRDSANDNKRADSKSRSYRYIMRDISRHRRQLFDIENHDIVLYTSRDSFTLRHSARASESCWPQLSGTTADTVENFPSLRAYDGISRAALWPRGGKMQRKRRKGRNRLGINDRRVEGGSDESTAHLANVPDRSSRGNRRVNADIRWWF